MDFLWYKYLIRFDSLYLILKHEMYFGAPGGAGDGLEYQRELRYTLNRILDVCYELCRGPIEDQTGALRADIQSAQREYGRIYSLYGMLEELTTAGNRSANRDAQESRNVYIRR